MRKRTLKKKIQGSMFKTACITLIITLAVILPMIYVVTIPATSFLSQLLNNYIMQNYIVTFDSDYEMVREWKSKNQINQLSVDELIDLYKQSSGKPELTKDIDEMLLSENKLNISIDSLDENNQKAFIVSMLNVVREVEGVIPFKDIILTEFKAYGKPIFSMPDDFKASSYTGISYFENMDSNIGSYNYFEKKLLNIYDDSKSILTIYDKKENVIGRITSSVNPTFVFFIMIPIVIVFIFSAFLALLVARLMSKLLSIPILKPVLLLNQQLSSIAADDFAFANHTLVDLKRPPKEIQSLRDNANIIMKKMQKYYEDLEEYKDELEAQNVELEAQNIELIESKRLIEDQQGQLVQSEKMASIGQLSAAIAHEINTPLGAIKSNSQMMESILPIIELAVKDNENTKIHKTINSLKNSNSISLDAANRMIEIIRNLKNFSRLDQSNYQEADITEGIKSVLVLTSNLWKNKIEMIQEYSDLPYILCCPSMLNQVFMNIIVNAIHACNQNGMIIIRTKSDNEFVYVEVEDNGAGIPAKEIDRIFDSGFTTKDKDNGTGLGLSISKDIVTTHKGTISVKSEVGKGSLFIVKLPIRHEHMD